MRMETEPLKLRLRQLPIHSVLAFVAKCARRLQSGNFSTAATASVEFEAAIVQLERHARATATSENPHDASAAVTDARRSLDVAVTEARHATSELIQSHVAATESIIRAARPTVPGPMTEIAKQRDSALAKYRAAAQHAREQARELASDKFAAAQRALRDARQSPADAAQADETLRHEIRHSGDHAVSALVDLLTVDLATNIPAALTLEIESLLRQEGDHSNIAGNADWPIGPKPTRYAFPDSGSGVGSRIDRAARLIIQLASVVREATDRQPR